AATAALGIFVVTIAIGWRVTGQNYGHSFAGFTQFVGDFDLSKVLGSLNLEHSEEGPPKSYETEEYGGFFLMLGTVLAKSDFALCASSLRFLSTFIPRLVWPSKPVFGRAQWVNAWIAGSEMKRDKDFAGPAISILGAAQLNGGAWATVVVLALTAVMLRAA